VPVHRCQRLPQFVFKQHAAIAAGAVHPQAPRCRVDVHAVNRGIPLRRAPRATCVILTRWWRRPAYGAQSSSM
jgi:hypothetical protein